MVTILSLVKEAQNFKMGMSHGLDDLVIYKKLHIPSIPHSPRLTITIRWKTLPPCCYKINVGGGVDAGHMYAGCVVRNSRGSFVGAFSLPLGRGVVLDAEILAGLHGLVFAHVNGWHNV